MTEAVTFRRLDAAGAEARLPELAGLLHACVLDGASVNFVLPFPIEAAEAFWRRKVLPPLASGGLVLLVAEREGRVVGSVQLDHDTPPNQPHRADVKKLLVHPDHRRQGIARALMTRIEEDATRLGRWLLTLDTRSGDKAEPLYGSLGYETAGRIPDYCLDTIDGSLWATTLMFKRLAR